MGDEKCKKRDCAEHLAPTGNTAELLPQGMSSVDITPGAVFAPDKRGSRSPPSVYVDVGAPPLSAHPCPWLACEEISSMSPSCDPWLPCDRPQLQGPASPK